MASMTTLAAVHAVLPPHRYPQEQITTAFAELCLGPGADGAAVRRVHQNTRVATRHLVLPIERYPELADFTAANDTYLTPARGPRRGSR